MKSLFKKVLPLPVANALRRMRSQITYKKYQGLSEETVFTDIYESGTWGRNAETNERFYSGTGSHDANVVDAYVSAVTAFLSSLPNRPNVVDLGCGDFAVGSKIRELCNSYIACDIVAPLIEHNKTKYAGLNVDFRHLDITKSSLPGGEVAFIRQVLQHLSNTSIERLLPSLQNKFKYIILTEHVCTHPDFKPNLDKPTGPDTRLGLNSGVVLTAAPFNLICTAQRVICEAKEDGGLIKTTIYTL